MNLWYTKTINRKHEMFWNYYEPIALTFQALLTVNMKCFEIATLEKEVSFTIY